MKKLVNDFKNSWFLLSICFKAGPLFTTWYMIDKIRNEVAIFLEHTLAVFMVLNAVEFGRPFREVAFLLLALFVFEIIHLSVDAFRQYKLAPKAMPRIQQHLKVKLFAKASEIDLESYDNPEFYNDYIMAINESDKQIDRILMTMENFVSSITRILFTGGFFLVIDPLSSLFVIISFGLIFVMDITINKLTFKRQLEIVPITRKAEYIQRVFYMPDYAKELRLNPIAADRLQQDHDNVYDEIQRVEKKYASRLFILNWLKEYVFSEFILNALYMLYLVYSALVLGRISIGSVAVLFNSAWILRYTMNHISGTITDIVDISRYVDRIKVFLDKKATIVSCDNLLVDKNMPAQIELKNVSFRYSSEGPYALYRVNLKIVKGQKTAIVGYNGAGKSTLVKLIMRLYDPTEGEILFNGINIKNYDVNAYRQAVGVIFQDFKIFAATVMENVLLDLKENGDENRVSTSLEKAGFTKRLARLTLGLNQPLTAEFEEDGVNLSGGEAQKVAIARAFYKDSPLIILDEPSSALDPIAEYHFNKTVTLAGREKTMVFISHRLSTTRISDTIFLMEEGRVAEHGTHESLLLSEGRYAKMWEAQTSRYDVG